RVARPVDADNAIAIETHLLEQCAREALHHIALDRVAQPLGIDDETAVMRDREFLCPNASGLPVDLDLGDRRDNGPGTKRVGNSAAREDIAVATFGIGRWARFPAGPLGGGLDNGYIAQRGNMSEAKRNGVLAYRCRDLVDELLAGKMDIGPHRIAKVRSAKRRATSYECRYYFPHELLVVEVV